MAITFQCDQCGKRYEVADGLAGKRARCKQCGNEFKVPELSLSAPRLGAPIPTVDPYGLDEEEHSPSNPAFESDEELVSRRTATTVKKKRKTSNSVIFTLAKLPIWAYGTYLAAIAAAIIVALMTAGVSRMFSFMAGAFLCFIPYFAYAFGYRFAPAFRVSFGSGLMYMFFPLIYRLMRPNTLMPVKLAPLSMRDVIPICLFFALFVGFLLSIEGADAEMRLAHAPKAPDKPTFFARANPKPVPVPPNRSQPARPKPESAKPPRPQPREAEPDPDRSEPETLASATPSLANRPAPPAESAYDRHERFAQEVLARINELADLLATVTNVPTAHDAAPRYKVLVQLLGDDQRRAARLPKLGMEEDKKLGSLFVDALKAAVERYRDEVERVQAIAGVNAVFTNEMLAFQPFVPGFNIRIAPRARFGPPTARPRPVPPTQDPESTLTVIVSGLPEGDSKDLVSEKIAGIMKSMGSSWSLRSSGGGSRWTFTIWPVSDARKFTDRIAFGTVTRVEGRVVEVAANPLPSRERPPSETDFVARVLFDLKSPASNRRRDALRKLKNAPPTDRRDEVARVVRPLLQDPEGFTRADAVRALASWGSGDDIPALLEVLKDPDFGVRMALFDTLKTLKDPKTAGPVADALPAGDRNRAADVLKAIGPPAEDAVSKYLKHSDGWVRMEAANILKEIGGEKSVPDLRRLAMTESGLDGRAARGALKSMAERGVDVEVAAPGREPDAIAPGKTKSKFGR